MGGSQTGPGRRDRYVAVIDQDLVTDEVRDIALKYDPLNRSGRQEGFHVTAEGELHIEDEKVMAEHKIVEGRIPNDAIRIVKLPAERGQLVHQYGENGFRLYELPAPVEGQVVGLLGPNGVGKTTALRILSGSLVPNLGELDSEIGWDAVVREFRGTAVQTYLERLRDGGVRAVRKPQRVDRIPDGFDGTVRDLLDERDERGKQDERDERDENDDRDEQDDRDGQDRRETTVERLDLDGLLDRDLADLSGGELQRVAVAATVVAEADVYLFDEPSSFLDVAQRLAVARVLRDLAGGGRRVVVVEHDLVSLDAAADDVHVLYGDPGSFGVVARQLSARRGINGFLAGYLDAENVRIRESSVDFRRRQDRQAAAGEPVVSFSELRASFPGFSLRVEPGVIREGEVVGVFGRNGLGKTTFARLLAGALDPEDGAVEGDVSVSYKPQYVEPAFDGTVRALFESAVDVYAPGFGAEIERPFDLEPLYERGVGTLSGGELQRVGIALALARDAEVYLLDEPSAFLDVEWRASLATALRSFVERTGSPCLLVDHDLLLLNYVADRAMVFEGEPGRRGVGRSPRAVPDGLNRFLAGVGVTFRRDPSTGRPRVNKPGSQKDREQKRAGEFFAG